VFAPPAGLWGEDDNGAALSRPGAGLADLMPIAAAIDWRKQRRLWRRLLPS
jgi:hypothetical protein